MGCRTPLASEAVDNFLNFVLFSANLETFCLHKYFVSNISRPIRKSTSLPQQRDVEHLLDNNKDGRMQHQMDALIEAGICYTKKMGGDAHAQYEGKHRVRYQPARMDGQPLTAAKLDIYQFYRKEFHEVLNVLITNLGDNHRNIRYFYGENLVVCLHAVEPIAKILQPPLQQPNLEDIFEMTKLFPPTMEVDPYSFHAEFGNFVSYSELTNTKFSSLYDTAKFSSKFKQLSPLQIMHTDCF